jgi:DNA-binding NtrC family response regulator
MDPSTTRVLIVDDDRDISSLLSALMNKEGLSSMMAHDGETALRMVPVERPDMLLVDVKMPGIDGMEVLKRVKETNPHLPVVLITAYAEVPASVAAMRAGAFDYLAKPFDHPEVIRVVAPPWPKGSAGAGPIPKKLRRTIVSGS